MWKVTSKGFNKDKLIHNGNKFLIGNGFLGYRGTLEEFEKGELVALNLPGVYDQYQDKWRESVNAPNPFYTKVYYETIELNALELKPKHHEQTLDISNGIFQRKTSWQIENKEIEIESERFISLANIHLMAMKYCIKANEDITITLETGIDLDVWDINGPHLETRQINTEKGFMTVSSITQEKQIPIIVSETVKFDLISDIQYRKEKQKITRQIKIDLKKDVPFTMHKFVYVNHHDVNLMEKSIIQLNKAIELGYDALYLENKIAWDKRWDISDVVIRGDDEAQFALRYSIYHLIILSQQHSDKVSIPARGISGQTYKGAIFWDTEMFMLPFYLATDIKTAINLVKYRIHTLEGARRKAREYGFRGAFYAWESQEAGDDACTHFNVTDVLTHRPMRTYFRDKQIHISGDIVYAIYHTFLKTQDVSLLISGGAEVILECARFYLSYGYQKIDTKQFELLDVTGPDEYHERVNNNAFTNRLVLETFKITITILDLLKEKHHEAYEQILHQLDYHNDYEKIKMLIHQVYLQQPNDQLLIEQFDGYFQLEDTTIDELKSRLLHPNEYWGGANGVASHTKIIKQADVVTMLYLFKDDYHDDIRKANWEYYEKRTEHGSSLSACMYALIACLNHNPDWAYPYFMKTASVDLTGETKQYAGDIYIGGTHPAANGGAYMTAIFGFAGVDIKNNQITVNPQLPTKWQGMTFKMWLNNGIIQVDINGNEVHIEELET